MAKKSTQLRPIIKLRSTAGTGYTYVTRKNRRNTPNRLSCENSTPSCAATSSSRRPADGQEVQDRRTGKTQEDGGQVRRTAAELKAIIKSSTATLDERMEASRALSALPRDSSPVRLRNRDQIDGRPRGYVGKAGVSRIRFREMAHRGELPGITKSSW